MLKHKHIALHVQEIKNETKHFLFFYNEQDTKVY